MNNEKLFEPLQSIFLINIWFFYLELVDGSDCGCFVALIVWTQELCKLHKLVLIVNLNGVKGVMGGVKN